MFCFWTNYIQIKKYSNYMPKYLCLSLLWDLKLSLKLNNGYFVLYMKQYQLLSYQSSVNF